MRKILLTLAVALGVMLPVSYMLFDQPSDLQAQTPPTPTPVILQLPPIDGKLNPPTYPKMDSTLNRIVADVSTGMSVAQSASAAPVHKAESILVTLYTDGIHTDAIADYLSDNGASVRNVGQDYIEVYVPVSLLVSASEQQGVVRVQTIIPPQPAQGAPSEAVGLHGADAWHAAGIKGQGIKVGVIDTGFDKFSDLMGTELPANVHVLCFLDVGVSSSSLSDCETEDDAHGTAVTEALFDIAPNAAYYISNPMSFGDLQVAVDWLTGQGVDVINHSAAWAWDGPGDGTSAFSDSPLRAVDAAVEADAIWVNAAGNEATATWFGAFDDSDGDEGHNYTNDIDCNIVEVEKDDRITLILRWDDSWTAANRDLDLLVIPVDDTGSLDLDNMLTSELPQVGQAGQIPIEFISNSPNWSATLCVVVRHFSGVVPNWMQLQAFSGQELGFHTLHGSIANPAESANTGLLAAGAADWRDPNVIMVFSSRGPTPDGRTKPDIVGVDWTYSEAKGERWGGTSLASPHVAGLAALVRQRFGAYSAEEVANYIRQNADARGAVPNDIWGYGFAMLPASDVSAPEPTATPLPPDVTPEPTVAPPTPIPVPVVTRDEFEQVQNRLTVVESLLAMLQGLIAALESRIAVLEDAPPAPPTPMPTATAVPPNATPEPTATAVPEPADPCFIPMPPGSSLPTTIESSWIEECVCPRAIAGVEDGDRYYRYTSFSVRSVSADWIATLTSDHDTYMLLWEYDVASEQWSLVGENDDMAQGNTNSRIQWTPTEGKSYSIHITTYNANTLGDFTLSIESEGANSQGSSYSPSTAIE